MSGLNRVKRFILLLLLVCLFSGVISIIRERIMISRQDKVVLRFAVTSKTSVYDETDTALTNYFEKVYQYAESHSYKKVDAFIINGNVTGNGSKEAFDSVSSLTKTWLLSGTRFYTTRSDGDFIIGDEGEKVADDPYIMEKLEDQVVRINGYTFIFMTPYYNYYEPKLEWLEQTLKRVTEYSEKPVFVFQFDALKDTYYGTESWYAMESENIMNIIEKYPMAVDFSSSSSTASNTMRSVFQKNASYVNTGVVSNLRMNFSEFGHDTYGELIHAGNEGVSQCKIVEVYGSGKVDILTMDLNTGNLYRMPDSEETLVFTLYPGQKNLYGYTKEDFISIDEPYFDENVEISIEKNENDETIMTFDNAHDKDGMLFYKVVVSDRVGTTIKEICTYADFSQWELPKSERVSLGVLEKGKYRVEIVPYDIFGTQGMAEIVSFLAE